MKRVYCLPPIKTSDSTVTFQKPKPPQKPVKFNVGTTQEPNLDDSFEISSTADATNVESYMAQNESMNQNITTRHLQERTILRIRKQCTKLEIEMPDINLNNIEAILAVELITEQLLDIKNNDNSMKPKIKKGKTKKRCSLM